MPSSFSASDVRAFSASDIKNAPPSSFSLRQAIKEAWSVLRHNFALVLCLTWPSLAVSLVEAFGAFSNPQSTFRLVFACLFSILASCNLMQLFVFGPDHFRRPLLAAICPTWAMWKFLGWTIIGNGVPILGLSILGTVLYALNILGYSGSVFLSVALALVLLATILFVFFPVMSRISFALYGLPCGLSFFKVYALAGAIRGSWSLYGGVGGCCSCPTHVWVLLLRV